jgi:putative lipoic acid-binding regulatory protein
MKKTDISIHFPCSYPLKVMGLNTEIFAAAVTAIFEKHLNSDGVSYSRRLSSGGKYLSITATFTAQSKDQLDALYQELNDHDLVVMTL